MSLEGQVLDGKYAIVRRIAEGGMSTIYLGVNQRIGKDVAVKVLRPVVAHDPEISERFEREARIASRIRSDHVADVFDFGELPTGERFMVMEYLEGESLATILEREHTVSPRTLATVASQILDALAAAHRAGVIHRDLKPENVIVTTRGKDVVVKVVDFGISKLLEPGSANRVKATAAGSVLGTPLYMSPEQARGQTNLVDQRTDLYSLGVIMYEATAGEPPLMGENVNDLLFRIALDEPEPLTSKVPTVDPLLAAIVRKAMAKDLADRYQTADEMLEAVDAWKATFAASTMPPASFEGVAASIRPSAPAVATPMSLTVPEPASNVRPPKRARSRLLRRALVAAPLLGLVVFFGTPIARRHAAQFLAPAVMPVNEVVPHATATIDSVSVPPRPAPAEAPSTMTSPDAPTPTSSAATSVPSAAAPSAVLEKPPAATSARPQASAPRPARPRRPTPRAETHDTSAADAGTLVSIVAPDPTAVTLPPLEPPPDPVAPELTE